MVVSEFGNDAGLIGAGYMALKKNKLKTIKGVY
jgi:hypothetical protein